MSFKKAFFYSLSLINLGILLVLLAFKGFELKEILSYELGFFGSFFIIIASYLHYKKRIAKSVKTQPKIPIFRGICLKKYEISQKYVKFYPVLDDIKLSVSQKWNLRSWFFLSGLKILAYTFLVLGFLILLKNELLSIVALFVGISAFVLGVLCSVRKINDKY